MSNENRFFQGTKFFVVSRLAAAVMSFLWVMVLAANLSTSATGLVLELFFISQMFVFLSDLGLSQALIRSQIDRHDLSGGIGRTLSAIRQRLLRMTFVLPILYLVATSLTDANQTQIGLMMLSHVATVTYTTVNTGMLALGRRFPEAIAEILSRVFVVTFGALFLSLQPTPLIGVTLYASADLFQLALVLGFLVRSGKTVRHNGKPKLVVSRDLKTKSAVAMASSSTFGAADYWAMSWNANSSHFATYALVMRVVDGGSLLASSAGYSQLPELVESMKAGDSHRWAVLLTRVRRMNQILLGGLLLVFFAAFIQQSLVSRFALNGLGIPILVLFASCPCYYYAKYLAFVLLALDPKASSKITVVTGVLQGVLVMGAYGAFDLSGAFAAVAFCNVIRYALIKTWVNQSLQSQKDQD